MMGHKYVFYGKIWINIPKLSLLPILILRTAANSSKEILTSHRQLHNRVIKLIITEGVLCIDENICR